jgi:hypothetical protein
MLEPCDAKVSSTVLRGPGDRKVAWLLDKAYWGLCTYNALTITVSYARADSARGTELWGWNRFP